MATATPDGQTVDPLYTVYWAVVDPGIISLCRGPRHGQAASTARHNDLLFGIEMSSAAWPECLGPIRALVTSLTHRDEINDGWRVISSGAWT